ncbi:hypothetical protein HDU67_008035 [Dinochytrium kinnereticum]|nr:hypothetical protein HDU67_008035 [Dinochytrium kinnereticum]
MTGQSVIKELVQLMIQQLARAYKAAFVNARETFHFRIRNAENFVHDTYLSLLLYRRGVKQARNGHTEKAESTPRHAFDES